MSMWLKRLHFSNTFLYHIAYFLAVISNFLSGDSKICWFLLSKKQKGILHASLIIREINRWTTEWDHFTPTKLEKMYTSDNSHVFDMVWSITITHPSWELQVCTTTSESNLATFSEEEMSKAYYPEVLLLDRNREKCSHVKNFSVLSYYIFKLCKPVKIKSGYYIKIVISQKPFWITLGSHRMIPSTSMYIKFKDIQKVNSVIYWYF